MSSSFWLRPLNTRYLGGFSVRKEYAIAANTQKDKSISVRGLLDFAE